MHTKTDYVMHDGIINESAIRECNFTIETNFGKDSAQALMPSALVLNELYALVLVENPFPKLSPWRNYTLISQTLIHLEGIGK